MRAEALPFEPRAAERKVRLIVDADEPLHASADPQRIGQVVRILLDNALRHTAEGSEVRLSVERRGEHLAIEVRDGGAGVSAEHLERLGEPLYRIDASRTRGTGGRGLGLSIARGIARAHDGSLSFESPPGSGLVATLLLPT